MCKVRVAAALVLGACGSAGAMVRWTGAGANGHWYAVSTAKQDWVSAEASAVAAGGTLATITSGGEQAFVQANLLGGAAQGLPLWIGLSDAAQEGAFRWVTGEAFSYSNWNTGTGEPNDYHNNGQVSGEDYVCINWHFAQSGGPVGTWNDTPLWGTGPANGAGYVSFGGTSDGPYYSIVEYSRLPGDANENGVIDADDFALIDRGFSRHLTGWANGDFDGDGVVGPHDYQLIDSSYAATHEGGGVALGAAGVVPEPAAFGWAAVATLVARRGRRVSRG